MVDTLTVLYTYRLHGALGLLPRLYTFLRQLAHELPSPLLLLDLGESCAPEVWHCAATDGRSILLALDAMGYHAAHVVGIAEASRLRLRGQVRLGLVDTHATWRFDVPPIRDEDIIISSQPVPALRLNIVLTPAPMATLHNGTLRLPPVDPGSVGSVQLDLRGAPALIETRTHALPASIRPEATIAAAIELIEEEARLRQ